MIELMMGPVVTEAQGINQDREPALVLEPRSPFPPWAWQVLWVAVGVIACLILFVEITGSINDMSADHQLAPSFAIAHGYQLYYGPEHGPVLSTIYGPITALFYLPATLGRSPLIAFVIAALLTLAVFYAATMFAIRSAAGRKSLSWWQLLAIVTGVAWFFPPISRVAMTIHADAPALAAAAIAAAFSMREKHRVFRWENEVAAGFFSVLALFAKQNVAPLLIVLALWMLLRGSGKALGVYAGSVVAGAGVILAVIDHWLGGLYAFYFNCIYIPLHQPYDKTLLVPAYAQLLVPSAAMLCLPLLHLVAEWQRWQHGLREFVLEHRNLLLVVIGIAVFPTSVAGRMKFGGYENALAPALYFFMLGALAELLNVAVATGERARQTKSALALVVIACIVGGVPATLFARRARFQNPAERVFSYCRSNPGKVYFPQFPLAQLLAGGKLYHFNWGLADRHAAGVPVSGEHFAANTPAGAAVMAMMPWVAAWDREMDSRHGPAVDLNDAPQLSGFNFYSFATTSAQNKARR